MGDTVDGKPIEKAYSRAGLGDEARKDEGVVKKTGVAKTVIEKEFGKRFAILGIKFVGYKFSTISFACTKHSYDYEKCTWTGNVYAKFEVTYSRAGKIHKPIVEIKLGEFTFSWYRKTKRGGTIRAGVDLSLARNYVAVGPPFGGGGGGGGGVIDEVPGDPGHGINLQHGTVITSGATPQPFGVVPGGGVVLGAAPALAESPLLDLPGGNDLSFGGDCIGCSSSRD